GPSFGEPGHRLGQLGLARACRTFHQNGLLQPVGEVHHACNALVGQVIDAAQSVPDSGHRLEARRARDRRHLRTWPSPWTTYFAVVSSRSPMGPRACSFCVLMPISAPKPNSSPSVKRVEALTITTAASTSRAKRRAVSRSRVQTASVWPDP